MTPLSLITKTGFVRITPIYRKKNTDEKWKIYYLELELLHTLGQVFWIQTMEIKQIQKSLLLRETWGYEKKIAVNCCLI